jgi:cytochrome c oxidase subunit 3
MLVISSVWCQLGVFKAERGQPARTGSLLAFRQWGMREWYVLTYIFGAIFVSGQMFEYARLIGDGLTISSDAYGSVFFLTTGFHAMHVTGGLIAFLLIIGRTFTTRRYTHAQAAGAIVTSYYWHFVDVVWIVVIPLPSSSCCCWGSSPPGGSTPYWTPERPRPPCPQPLT